ncbi:MAG: glycosyltransferase family A protein [bacterium]|nr:glycosyltransferase family A protein [bacterium]
MNEPLISVVVAAYNSKDLLKDSLQSLITQNFDKKNYEIIVVDDGSKDGTSTFLEEFIKDKTNIRYVKQKNKGVASARNTGIKLSKGKIVAFTDQDCLADKNWLKEIAKSFLDKELIGVSGCVITETKKVNPFAHYVLDETAGNFISCNVAYRKDILEKLNGFDIGFNYGFDDTDLYLRATKLGKLTSNKNAVICHRVIPWSFVKFVKRIKVEYNSQFKFSTKYPHIYKNRNIILSILWGRGLKAFFIALQLYKKWIFKNPIIYEAFIFGLLLQRYYLLYLCIGNRNVAKT